MRVYETPFVVTLLGPRIGKQNEHAGKTRGRQPMQHEACIVHENANIVDAVGIECLDQLGYTIKIRFASEKGRIWSLACLFE